MTDQQPNIPQENPQYIQKLLNFFGKNIYIYIFGTFGPLKVFDPENFADLIQPLNKKFQQAKLLDLGQFWDAQVAKTYENQDLSTLTNFDHLLCDFMDKLLKIWLL